MCQRYCTLNKLFHPVDVMCVHATVHGTSDRRRTRHDVSYYSTSTTFYTPSPHTASYTASYIRDCPRDQFNRTLYKLKHVVQATSSIDKDGWQCRYHDCDHSVRMQIIIGLVLSLHIVFLLSMLARASSLTLVRHPLVSLLIICPLGTYISARFPIASLAQAHFSRKVVFARSTVHALSQHGMHSRCNHNVHRQCAGKN